MKSRLSRNERIARAAFYLMFIPVFFGMNMSSAFKRSSVVAIRQFRDEQHIQAIANAFRFELNPSDTLYVSHYRSGGWQDEPLLIFVVEDVGTVDSFLSRLRVDVEEINSRNTSLNEIDGGINRRFAIGGSDFRALLSFFRDGDVINAEITMTVFPPSFRGLRSMLDSYIPKYYDLFFLLPVTVHAAIFIYRLVLFARRRKEKAMS